MLSPRVRPPNSGTELQVSCSCAQPPLLPVLPGRVTTYSPLAQTSLRQTPSPVPALNQQQLEQVTFPCWASVYSFVKSEKQLSTLNLHWIVVRITRKENG